jgi:hypothetical protein
MILKLLFILTLHLLAKCTSASHKNSTASELEAILANITPRVIYFNGLQTGWESDSQGANIVSSDGTLGNPGLLSAKVQPWGKLAFRSTEPFDAQHVLDTLIKFYNNSLRNAEIYLKNNEKLTYSPAIVLSTPSHDDKNHNVSRILGPDDNGWLQTQISLSALTGHPNSTWDEIIFQDISGFGFSLQIESMVLVPVRRRENPDTPNEGDDDDDTVIAQCVGEYCSPLIEAAAPETKLVPLLGEDLGVAISSVSSPTTSIIEQPEGGAILIADFIEGTTEQEIAAFCKELQGGGALDGSGVSRFNGACIINNNNGYNVVDLSQQQQQQLASWRLVPVKVDSEDDLLAIRTALVDKMNFIEYDGDVTVNPISSHNNNNNDDDGEVIRMLLEESELSNVAGAPSPPSSSSSSSSTFSSYVLSPSAEVQSGDVIIPDAKAIFPLPWGLDRIDQTSLPLDNKFDPEGLTGAGIHIYNVDTGIRADHIDFEGRIGRGVNCADGGGVCREDISTNDGQGHGTHTAGIAAGKYHGVAKNAVIHSVKTMGNDGSGSYSNIIAGLNWILQDVKKNGWRGVVNMSLGGRSSASMNAAVKQLTDAGVIVVASAGNSYRADACSQSPASAPESITVASTDKRDQLSSFSNIGSCVDILAPGSDIVSAGIASDVAESTLSGTSMATPYVTGTVALILEKYPTATPAQVTTYLMNGAARVVAGNSVPPLLVQAKNSRF